MESAKPHEFKAVRSVEVPLSKLVFDGDLYPRIEIHGANVSALAEKIRAGINLDPICVEIGTFRIVDGVHRWKAYARVLGEDAKVHVLVFKYKNENDLVRHSVRLNLHHGERLNKQDMAMIVSKLLGRGLSDNDVEETLGITRACLETLKIRWAHCEAGDAISRDANGEIVRGRGRAVDEKNDIVFLKRGTAHLSGQTLTKAQVRANDKYLGHNQTFVINQVIGLIEGGILDRDDEHIMARIRYLGSLIAEKCSSGGPSPE